MAFLNGVNEVNKVEKVDEERKHYNSKNGK